MAAVLVALFAVTPLAVAQSDQTAGQTAPPPPAAPAGGGGTMPPVKPEVDDQFPPIDTSGVFAELTNLILGRADDQLKVFHLVKLVNNRADAASNVHIPLLPGFANVNLIRPESGAAKVEGDGVTISRAIAPAGGVDTLILTYDVPLPAQGYSAALKVAVPTSMTLIMADSTQLEMPEIQNTQLFSAGTTDVEGKMFLQFVRPRIPAGTDLKLNVAKATGLGLPEAGAGMAQPYPEIAGEKLTNAKAPLLNKAFHGGTANVMLWQRYTGYPGHGGLFGAVIILSGLGGAALGGARLYFLRYQMREAARRRMAAGQTGPSLSQLEMEERVRMEKERRVLVRRIAELDRSLAAGTLTPDEHRRQRSLYKRHLVRVMQSLKGVEQ